MKKIVTKSLTDTGGLTIPIDMRFRTGIRENRLVDIIDLGDGTILIRKHIRKCMFCNGNEKVMDFHGMEICTACREELNNWEEHIEDLHEKLGIHPKPYGDCDASKIS